jgi:hypothetical protein
MVWGRTTGKVGEGEGSYRSTTIIIVIVIVITITTQKTVISQTNGGSRLKEAGGFRCVKEPADVAGAAGCSAQQPQLSSNRLLPS